MDLVHLSGGLLVKTKQLKDQGFDLFIKEFISIKLLKNIAIRRGDAC
jgi:hypothetical protein